MTAGTKACLTPPTEWDVLEVLVRADGLIVPGADLLAQVWGPAYGSQTNHLPVYSAQLRRKLERDPRAPRYLIPATGPGHRLDAAGSGASCADPRVPRQ